MIKFPHQAPGQPLGSPFNLKFLYLVNSARVWTFLTLKQFTVFWLQEAQEVKFGGNFDIIWFRVHNYACFHYLNHLEALFYAIFQQFSNFSWQFLQFEAKCQQISKLRPPGERRSRREKAAIAWVVRYGERRASILRPKPKRSWSPESSRNGRNGRVFYQALRLPATPFSSEIFFKEIHWIFIKR